MKRELTSIFNKVFIEIDYDTEEKWLYSNWVGYQTYENVVTGANACIEYIKKFNCTCVLNDNRELIGRWDHSTEWIATDWTPRAVQAGLRYFAHVVTQETLAQMSAEQMHQKAEGVFEMKVFSDIEKAKSWLKQCPKN